MKSCKSRQDGETPSIDVAPIRIRYRVAGALDRGYCSARNEEQSN